jgi:hypothetical protein
MLSIGRRTELISCLKRIYTDSRNSYIQYELAPES